MTLRFPDWWDSHTRVLAIFVALTIVPAACVLWFMNVAVASDAAAAQQQILTAYRGQLRLVRARLDGFWRGQAERLNATGDPSREFQRLITGQVAEGAVLTFREEGFPDPMRLVRFVQERPDDFKMRPDGKLVVQGGWPEATQRLKALRAVLESMARVAQKKAA